MKLKGFILFLLIASNTCVANASGSKEGYHQRLRTILSEFELPSVSKIDKNSQGHRIIGDSDLSSKQQTNLIFSVLLPQSEIFANILDSRKIDVLDKETVRELSLLRGKKNPSHSVAARTLQLETALGKSLFAGLLRYPATQSTDLNIFLENAKKLAKNPKARKEIRKALQEFSKTERQLLNFWSSQDVMLSRQDRLFAAFYPYLFKKDSYTEIFLRPFLKANNCLFLEFQKYTIIMPAIYFALSLNTFKASCEFLYQQGGNFLAFSRAWGNNFTAYRRSEASISQLGSKYLSEVFLSHNAPSWGLAFNMAYGQFISAIYAFSLLRNDDARQSVNFLRSRANMLNILFQCQKNIKNILETDGLFLAPMIDEVLQPKGQLLKLERIVSHPSHHSQSYYLSRITPALQMFELMLENKDLLIDIFVAFGIIDIICAMGDALELKEKYSLVKGHEAKYPELKIKNFRNPLINSENVIVNSLSLDGEKRNAIIVGPNAGGKSTFMTGVLINAILAQSIGFTCSEELEMTFSSKIMSSSSIEDDISNNNSRYMAELKSARSYFDTIKNNAKDQNFVLGSLDELFSGTNPREGSAAAYAFIRGICQEKNALNLVATHYLEVAEKLVENESSLQALHVSAEKNELGKTTFPFRILPGLSKATIGLDLFEENGFPEEMINEARQGLETLE